MANENIPSRDSEYGPWIINFASVATANATLLNLTVGQTTNISTLATAFENSLIAANADKATAKGSTAVKNNMRTASEQAVRGAAKLISANPNISPTLKTELGMNVSPSPGGPLVPVTELTSAANENGTVLLTWNRNGNNSRTIFVVQAKTGVSGPWQMVGSTTRVRFTRTGQIPGELTFFRVISQRGEATSFPSTQSSVYAPEDAEVFTLKAA